MVKEQIVIIFNENKKRYGYRRITKELHNNDICVNHKTVRKLMKQLGLVCQVRAKRKYSSYKGEVGEVAPNLLERHFKTNQPNRKWVTDVTEFKVNDQKLYLSPILDLFNGEVVSYNLSRHPNFKQITDMLEGAFQKLPDKVDNLILHSDQGWQYQMKSYQNLLKAKGLPPLLSFLFYPSYSSYESLVLSLFCRLLLTKPHNLSLSLSPLPLSFLPPFLSPPSSLLFSIRD